MTTKFVWTGPQAVLEQASTVLSDVLYPPADAISLVKEDSTAADADSGWALHAYFEETPETGSIDAAFEAMDIDLAAPVVEALPDQDWVAHSLAGLGVVEAGKFILFGSHDAARAAEIDGIKLQIEANRAFGTGHHPTTAGCLEALTRLSDLRPGSVLDVGTGSGILAIAARKLWRDAVIVGTDIDAPSVTIAAENAALNQADNILFAEADGLGAMTDAHGPFPLILANILADPLIGLAPEISAALAPGGKIVLAGLLDRQEDAVINAYKAVGRTLLDRVDNDTWPVLVLG